MPDTTQSVSNSSAPDIVGQLLAVLPYSPGKNSAQKYIDYADRLLKVNLPQAQAAGANAVQIAAFRSELLRQLDRLAAELQALANRALADLQKVAPVSEIEKITGAIVAGVSAVLPLFGPLVSAAYATGLKREKREVFNFLSVVVKDSLENLDAVNALRKQVQPATVPTGANLIGTDTNNAFKLAALAGLALLIFRR